MLFADSGLSDASISVLLAIWSLTSVVFEVPSGALADRFSRRGCLVASGVLQAFGYAAWVLFPSFWGFAAGFVLWGLGGTLQSGAFEALLYDGLAANGDEDRYGRLNARVDTIELIAQVPVAVIATALFSFGGYELAGWASVAMCLASSVIALRFPEPERDDEDDDELGYLATLKTGLRASVPIKRAVLAVALVYSIDAFEEYFTLLAQDWSVPTVWVPMATIGVPLMGAAGASLAGRLPFRGWVLFASGATLIAAALLAVPLAIILLGLFYGLYRFVLVHVETELQHRIESDARATVTSVAAIGSEFVAFAIYGLWVLGSAVAIGVMVLVVALVIWRR
ncbi:MFS transporter [Lentzea flaviverrucosa]|uniref:Major Facilitator Superfamily protein n=1 Tax=Lentzea flaviverrucosa TaxID=200379 RepID=A0A1H9K1X5_9PSEU|nr:MFS transporter [Lentzea flaviverrucosa]RDI26714.1 MFS transporter [Lentzea flaviverrucosa]SEQ93079.1 Major Facilitator Superfamily protein [Lentzea flaviverrucosa]